MATTCIVMHNLYFVWERWGDRVRRLWTWRCSHHHLSRDMTKLTSDCASSENSDQPGHPPSLIRVFAVRMKKAWILSYPLSALRRLWTDWADTQADLSLRWAHTHFVGFVMSRLICLFILHSLCFVHFLFPLVSGVSCGLWLWHYLDFSINFFNRRTDGRTQTHSNREWHERRHNKIYYRQHLFLYEPLYPRSFIKAQFQLRFLPCFWTRIIMIVFWKL